MSGNISTDDNTSFKDNFERLCDELVRQNADVCVSSAPSPCTEAWMKLASLLQMRSSYLEHQVRELQEANESLDEDVHWHIEALGELGERLREARFERATALAELRDRQEVRSACSKCDMASSAADEGSCYTDITDPGPSTSYLGYDEDNVTQHNNAPDATSTHAPELTPYPPAARAMHLPATGFYLYPDSSVLTLLTEPPQSFQWPLGTTLEGIRENLISRHECGIEDNVHLAAVLEIIDQREIMGVQLPGPTRDSAVWIDVPDAHGIALVDNDVQVDAWRSRGSDMVPGGCGMRDPRYR